MENGNNPAPAGTADTQADSQVPENLTQAELEDEIGAAFEASLEESEQAEKQPAKAAKDETSESNEEAEKTEEEPEAEEEPETEEGEKQPATIKLKDGTEVPLDDVVNGYLRQSDYTRKTQELARDRQALEQSAEKIVKQFEAFKFNNELALRALARIAPKQPDPDLINKDPIGYMQQQAAFDQARKEFEQLAQGHQGYTQQEQERIRQEQHAHFVREQQALFEKLPELSKKETAEAFWKDAVKYGAKWGLTAEDIGSVTDHRLLLALKSAVAYEKSIVAHKMEAVRAAKNAPPIRSAARPGPSTANARAMKDALQNAREKGTVESVAETIPDEWFQ